MKGKYETAGMILAAGFSSRMKDFKPLMKIGGKTPLEILIRNMQMAGIKKIFVVVGFQAEKIVDFLQGYDVSTVVNEHYEEGMFSSIRAGIRAAREAGSDGVLMTPVDVPLIPPYIMKAALARREKNPGNFIVPVTKGKKGHPLYIPAVFFDEIIQEDHAAQGMKTITGRHPDRMVRFDTHCDSMLLDMDTPEAYRELTEYYEAHRFPDRAQCDRIFERSETPGHIIRHCEAVARTAVTMGEALNACGGHFDLRLLLSAGLTHDVLRLQKRHDDVGAELMEDYGYPEVAEIVRDHMRYMHPLPVTEIDEKDLIVLSDKLRQEDRLVTLEERLAPVRQKWKDDPEALAAITGKITSAEAVRLFVEQQIGESVYDLLRRKDQEAAEERQGERRRVVLVRHGSTQKHTEKIFMGQTDVPLNMEGRDECVHVGLELQHFDLQTDRIYASDLKRAMESAAIISDFLGEQYQVEAVPEFREIALGHWDGRPIREIQQEEPDAYEERGSDLLHFKIDADAENFVGLQDRVMKRFRQLVQETEGDLVIVSHSGVVRILKSALQKKPLESILNMKFARGTYEILTIPESFAVETE